MRQDRRAPAEAALQRTIFEAERGSLRRLPGTIYSGVQARRLARFERASCEGVAHVISVSDADAEAHRQLAPGTPVSVVPNGIDVQTYEQADSTLDLGPAALVFTGSMNYRPNVDAALWFAENVLGRVRQQIPDAKFFVVGSQPHRRLDTLRERYLQLRDYAPTVVVEGAGGWLVPVDDKHTLADLAVALRLPVVLVVGLRLGCISHALLTAQAIAASGLPLAGWVANHIDPQMLVQQDNIATLQQRLQAPCLGIVPRLETVDVAQAAGYLGWPAA